MAFRNAYESHEHSLQTLELILGYDSFLDSLHKIADFGCGAGLDSQWWATLESRDDPPEPRNYIVYAVDQDTEQIEKEILDTPNVHAVSADLEHPDFPLRNLDLIWCHDVFQYMINPMSTLRNWNLTMSANGMLMLSFPQNISYQYNRLQHNSRNGCFYNHSILSLMYMLAVNGFDCKDAYFYKNVNDPWIYAAVYKSSVLPMDPRTTTWAQLADLDLVNDSVKESINRYNYVRQEDILVTWLDRDFYRFTE